MITVLWYSKGLMLIDSVNKGLNAKYNILCRIILQILNKKGLFHQDNVMFFTFDRNHGKNSGTRVRFKDHPLFSRFHPLSSEEKLSSINGNSVLQGQRNQNNARKSVWS